MALKVAIQQSKEVTLWKEYKDSEGNVLAEFKIRGSDYKAYRVAVERAQNQLSSKGYDVATAGSDDKLYHELLLEAAACHLVAEWKGVIFVENGKEFEPECSPENATKLFNIVKLLYYSYRIRKKLEITHRLSRSTILYAYV